MKYGWCVNILYSIPPTQSGTAYTRVSVMRVCYVCTFTARLQPWCTFSHFLCTYLLKPVLFDLTAFQQFFSHFNRFVITVLLQPLQIKCTANVCVCCLLFMAFVCGSFDVPNNLTVGVSTFTWCHWRRLQRFTLNLISIQSRSTWQGNQPKSLFKS